MIVWVIDSESGVKLLYKSFMKLSTDEDIISGFLTAFNQFSEVQFQQSLESIEMGGLRWVYTMDPRYNLLFVAAENKNIKTEIVLGRLEAIKKAFVEKYKSLFKKRGDSWDGNVKVFLPFAHVIEDYYKQWGEGETLNQVADLYDILRIFQQILIKLGNIVNNRMYSKSRNIILNLMEEAYNSLLQRKKFRSQPELKNITFSKETWFNLVDIDLVKCDKEILIDYLKSIFRILVTILVDIKGKNLCLKYFNEEKIYSYIYNNLKFLQDLNLDMFFLELFFLI